MDAQTLLSLMEQAGKLKVLPRTGWLLRGMKNPESVADHLYRTSLLSMVLADILVEQGLTLDAAKVMRMAMLHDLAESQVGDIPYPAMAFIDVEVKHASERAALQKLLKGFGPLTDAYMRLWEEFEAGETAEARLVRAADKLELMIQVYEYEKVGYRSLGDFWENMANYNGFAVYPVVEQVMALIRNKHQELLPIERRQAASDLM
ncbi:MAG: HD family hydrolase [Chloroflexi bacterium]|nr:HD family hydrolase [Chloroflexota bacterium]